MISGNLGTQMKLARKAKGITQEQLAAALHVSRQTISNWENARSQPDYEMLQKLADLLDLNLAALFGVQAAAPENVTEEKNDEEPFANPIEEPTEKTEASELPASPEVVQPPAKRRALRRWMPVAALALAALVCAVMAVRLPSAKAAYPMEWFAAGQRPVEGQAYINVYAKTNAVPLLSASTNDPARWSMTFFFREEGGVGFQIEQLLFIYFFEDGTTQTEAYGKAHIGSVLGSSHLNAYALTRFSDSYPHQPDAPVPLGTGCVIEGTDDTGHDLAFGLYLPFEQP